MKEVKRKKHYGGWVFLLILIVVGVGVYLNRQWLYDYFRGATYQPADEMVRIRNDLNLTGRGEFLFNATQPELNEATEFNNHCRDSETEIAILGCYAAGNIYIYNITEVELKGIRELTTAHELLHAVFARMSDDEKNTLRASLDKVYNDNKTILMDDLKTYDATEQFEELYVRAGTEVKNLPDDLEKHYAEIFKDQDKIVDYYDSYISVFRILTAEMDGLKIEMDAMNTQIDTKTTEYERRVAQLNADIVSFNGCAKAAGCFKSEEEFETKRGALVNEQMALKSMYEEINQLIAEYNTKVELYNADVTKGEKLNSIINSTSKPKEIGE